MSKLTKKIVVGLIALTMVLGGTAAVFAENEEDLQDELDAVRAELAEFQALVAELLGGEVEDDEDVDEAVQITGIPENFTFTTPLREGSRGTDVKYLQILLNTDPATKVAETGAGSPGNETEYFGPATKAAVIKFQNKYTSEVLAPIGLSAGTGYVGNQTIAKLNKILADGEVVTPPADDDVLTMILEQLEVFAAAIEDIGKRVERLEDPSKFEDEGYFEVEVRSAIRNVELVPSETADVAMFRINAYDSDVTVQRMDVAWGDDGIEADFEEEDMTASHFRSLIDNMALYVDGEKVAEKEISRATVERDDEYIRFSGLSIEVPKDGYKDVVIEVTAADDDDPDYSTVFLGFREDAIRALDGAGLTAYNEDKVERRFYLIGEEEGTLEVRRHTNNPEEGIVIVSKDRFTEVDLLKFNVTAKDYDIELDTLTVHLGGNATDLVEDLILFDGDSEVDVIVASAGTNTFDVDLDIARGATKTFTVVADVQDIDVDEQGGVIKAELRQGDNQNIGYDVFDNDVSIDRTIRGYDQALFVTVPNATLKSSSISVTTPDSEDDRLSANMTVSVTALGGDVYLTKEGVNIYEGDDWNTIKDYFEDLDKEEENVVIDDDGKLVLDEDGEYYVVLDKVTGDEVADALAGKDSGLYIVYNVTDDGIYEWDGVETADLIHEEDDLDMTTLYVIYEDETEDLRFRGQRVAGAGGSWYKFEMGSVMWYAQHEDGKFYYFEFDKTMDDIDDLETDEVFAYGN